MGDERVRPQQRRHTKKGWKTTINKNGANHIKMDGQTVKAGDMFDLGNCNGVKAKAKAPSQSGVAGHDCNCRCFLEYNLMTAEEFAKATGQKIKTQKTEKVELQLSDYPEMFTKGAEGKNTQKLIDYINGLEGADTNALKLYSSIGTWRACSASFPLFPACSRRLQGFFRKWKYAYLSLPLTRSYRFLAPISILPQNPSFVLRFLKKVFAFSIRSLFARK